MDLITGIVIFLRFLQTAAYISLFFFSLIRLKEPGGKRVALTLFIFFAAAVAYCMLLGVWGQVLAENLIVPVEVGMCLILILLCSADKWPVSLFVMFTQFNLYLGVAYLNAQTQRVETAPLFEVCEHPAANAILARWAARAQENGIKTELDAGIPARLPMDEVALVGILANSFENAVEGCLRCPDAAERFVAVKIAYSVYNNAGKLHIVVENSCEDNLVFESGFPKSQKPGGGTGTRSIQYTAEQYGGMAEFSAQNGVFRTRVLLHLPHPPC